MYFTIYKITNVINSKVYIGMHKTKDLEDGYMGSGVAITRAIEKYGVDNFTKEYLHIVETKEEMRQLEESIITQEFIDSRDNYNIRLGGQGGFSKEEGLQGNLKKKWLRENNPEWVTKCSKSNSIGQINSYKNGRVGSFKDKEHQEKTITLMKETHLKNKHQQGKKNSQYGTMWIYNLELKISKKISKGDIIPDGWLKGRKIKF